MDSTQPSPADDVWGSILAQQKWIMDTPSLSTASIALIERESKDKPKDYDTTRKGGDVSKSDESVPKLNALLTKDAAEIVDIGHNILRLQLEIHRLSAEVKALLDTRSQKHMRMNQCKALLSPVRLLPPEILTRVFEYSLPKMVFPSTTSPPLVLCQVCSAWRDAALGAPSLWESIWFDPDQYTAQLGMTKQLIDRWFSRAGRRPLCFGMGKANAHVDEFPDGAMRRRATYPRRLYGTLFNRFANDAFRCLSTSSYRLSELSLDLRSSNAVSHFFLLPEGSFPYLETIIILAQDACIQRLPQITVFRGADRLRRAKLGFDSEVQDEILREFPWSQITHFVTAHQVTFKTFSNLIFQCINLHEASFAIEFPDPDFVPSHDDGSVTFEHLQNLRIAMTEGFVLEMHIADVLSRLQMPAIQMLELVSIHRSFCPLYALLPGLSESSWSLRCLVLSRVNVDLPRLSQLLSPCVSLEKLAVYIPEIQDGILPMLSALQKDSNRTLSQTAAQTHRCLRRLTTFAIAFLHHSIRDPDLLTKQFADLASARSQDAQGERRLERIVLYICVRDEEFEKADNLVKKIAEGVARLRAKNDDVALDTRVVRDTSGIFGSLGWFN
ncbi:hypothetical protein LshimejAT787_1300030 [Lyophyllum shimeji]|uniref:F-box domain-containing protein n=1 Tax=Lyophyllum shimeji TaxID=47721 RepID=A0A9P3PUF7_LYOSH|nr:hypothetical protein LshimejAT787_1300030 [Lyophyllum shimeji]